MDREQQVEELLEQPYYVIDFLPRQVQKDEGYFFFEVEEYFLNSNELDRISEKFIHIILKTLCYFEFSVYKEKWLNSVTPKKLASVIKKVVTKQKGFIYILLSQNNILIEINGGDLHISVFNCNEKVESIMKALAISEGLFLRKFRN
ncbi:hypothetical protein [Lacrimispora sp.]|uniref:hypothetical protein n=1 Tax=Lacrimispora sp. TaxID=2719234 RepID=UPI00399399D8